MDVRSIEARAPRMEHEGTTSVWWMYDAREAFEETTGGHLELVSELEIAGGATLHIPPRAAHDYLYVLSGRGLMTVLGEPRQIGPGDLVTVPPHVEHSLTPVSAHAPIRCLRFIVARDGDAVAEPVAAPLQGSLYRSACDVAPQPAGQSGVAEWWLVAPGELAGQTAGGHLELANEWEVAGGGAVHTHAHPTVEFYYGVTGRGVMTIDDEDRHVVPGDLVLIPPDAPHSIRPVSENAPIRCFCFAVGLAGSDAYDYANDHTAAQ